MLQIKPSSDLAESCVAWMSQGWPPLHLIPVVLHWLQRSVKPKNKGTTSACPSFSSDLNMRLAFTTRAQGENPLAQAKKGSMKPRRAA